MTETIPDTPKPRLALAEPIGILVILSSVAGNLATVLHVVLTLLMH